MRASGSATTAGRRGRRREQHAEGRRNGNGNTSELLYRQDARRTDSSVASSRLRVLRGKAVFPKLGWRQSPTARGDGCCRDRENHPELTDEPTKKKPLPFLRPSAFPSATSASCCCKPTRPTGDASVRGLLARVVCRKRPSASCSAAACPHSPNSTGRTAPPSARSRRATSRRTASRPSSRTSHPRCS